MALVVDIHPAGAPAEESDAGVDGKRMTVDHEFQPGGIP
jgi:hypothetical protein